MTLDDFCLSFTDRFSLSHSILFQFLARLGVAFWIVLKFALGARERMLSALFDCFSNIAIISLVLGKEDRMSNSHYSHHHSRKPKSGDSRRDGSSWSSQSNFRKDTYHSNQHTSSYYYGRANVNPEPNLAQNSRYEYASSFTNNKQQQEQKKARSDPVISAVQPQPEYVPSMLFTAISQWRFLRFSGCRKCSHGHTRGDQSIRGHTWVIFTRKRGMII